MVIMRRLIIFLLFVVMFLPESASAQLYAMRDSVKDTYDFWLYVPQQRKGNMVGVTRRDERPIAVDSLIDERIMPLRGVTGEEFAENTSERVKGLPIVLFLHGRSLCGRDLYRVRRYGCIDALSMGRNIEAVVIAPQNRGDWWNPDKLVEIIDWVSERYDVDTDRLYVLGMSLGGYGTIDFVATYPERTAAAIALCGGASKRDLSRLGEAPLWIIHGTADRAVGVTESRRVKEAMQRAGTTERLRYDEWKGVDHGRLARVFYIGETYEWLFKHSLSDKGRPADMQVQITNERLATAYRGMNKSDVVFSVHDPRPYESSSDSSSSKGTRSTARYHTVRSGDTLSAIAARNGTTVARLCQLNGISRKSILRLGQKIRLN